jgi:hypothetical protein
MTLYILDACALIALLRREPRCEIEQCEPEIKFRWIR